MERTQAKPLVCSSSRETRLLAIPVDKSVDVSETQGKPKGKFLGIRHQPSRMLKDLDHVGDLLCLTTPGHTPGHISFLDERDGTLYADDTPITYGGEPHLCGFGPPGFSDPREGPGMRC